MATEVVPTPASVSNHPRILVADDARISRGALGRQLRERFDLRAVGDGESAWQAVLLDATIRVLIADLTLPRLDGFDLLSRVRASKVQRVRDLPVIVITGDNEVAERERAASLGATDFIRKSAGGGELVARLDVLVRLATAREQLADSQATLESARTIDPDTELLSVAFFDKQAEKLIAFARRNLSDVALICVRVDLSMPQSDSWEGEIETRIKLVGRALAASIRLEDMGTRTDRFEFCVATQTTGLAGILRFASRLRKVLENIDAAGPGVEVWTSIGVATLSEELRRGGEELRLLAQRRAQQAQTSRSRRIVFGTSDGMGAAALDGQGEEGSMDINLALALIRAGRPAEVVPHLVRLLEQMNPLLRLVRQQQELQSGRLGGQAAGAASGQAGGEQGDGVPGVLR